MKPKRPLPPGVTTSDIDHFMVDFTNSKPPGKEDAPDMATVHLKTGITFSLPVADLKGVIPPENLRIEIAYPGGFASKYSTKAQDDGSEPNQPSIEKRMVPINFGIVVNFPRGFDSDSFFEVASQIAAGETAGIQMLERMLPAHELLTEPMRRLVALQCVELEHAKRLLADGDESGAEHHLLIAEELSSEFMALAGALPSLVELRSSKAGKARSARHKPLRQECARLLREHRPPEGWKSHAAAACTIASDLSDFAECHPESAIGLGSKRPGKVALKDLDLFETIRRWIGRDPLIRQAYSGRSG